MGNKSYILHIVPDGCEVLGKSFQEENNSPKDMWTSIVSFGFMSKLAYKIETFTDLELSKDTGCKSFRNVTLDEMDKFLSSFKAVARFCRMLG